MSNKTRRNRRSQRADSVSKDVGKAVSQLATDRQIETVEWKDRLSRRDILGLLTDLNGLIGRIESSLRDRSYAAIEAATATACYLKSSPAAWAIFCNHEQWGAVLAQGRPTPDKRPDALTFVMKFTVGLGRNNDKSASRYKLAAEFLLGDGVAADRIADTLHQRGGIDGVLKERAEARELGKHSEALLNRPGAIAEPVAKVAEGDPPSTPDTDPLVAVPVRLSLPMAKRDDWLASKALPRKLRAEVHIIEVVGGTLIANLISSKDLETLGKAKRRNSGR